MGTSVMRFVLNIIEPIGGIACPVAMVRHQIITALLSFLIQYDNLEPMIAGKTLSEPPTLTAANLPQEPIKHPPATDNCQSMMTQFDSRCKVADKIFPQLWWQPGQAVVEMVFVTPILLALLALAVTGGQLINSAVSLSQAARAGAIAAQAAYVQGTNQTTAAENAESLDLGSAYSSVTTVVTDPSNPQTGQVMVQVSLTETVRPLFAWFAVVPIRTQAEEGS